jgi:SAM-dependent methyltransferase
VGVGVRLSWYTVHGVTKTMTNDLDPENAQANGGDAVLEAAFGAAQPEHYAWQTTAPYVAAQERALCEAAFLPLGRRVLDLGCGEGATLFHLGGPEGAVGVDLFEPKLAFAREHLPRCRFVVASALDLPFPEGSFDQVLVRDVIHHIPEPRRLLEECHRVLSAGGRIDVLEPCRYNPLIFAHALSTKVERGELRSTEPFLIELVRRRFRIESTARHQPLPIHRIVFHPAMGSPELAKNRTVSAAVAAVERVAARLMPKVAWAYVHVRAYA